MRIRYVASNPSTYTYFDDRRWINDTLVPVPAAERRACPEALEYFYGTGGRREHKAYLHLVSSINMAY
jgi:hypothetical protein